MINIIVLSYKKLPQADLNTFASTVYQKMTEDAQFVGLKSWVDALKIANEKITYIASDKLAITPGSLYQTMRKRTIRRKPISPAFTPDVFAFCPWEAPTVCVETSSIGTGSAP